MQQGHPQTFKYVKIETIYIYIYENHQQKHHGTSNNLLKNDRIIIAYFGKQLIGACTCSKGRFGAMTYKTHLETVLPGRPTKCCFSLVQFINYHYDFRNSVCFIIIHYHSLSFIIIIQVRVPYSRVNYRHPLMMP